MKGKFPSHALVLVIWNDLDDDHNRPGSCQDAIVESEAK